MKILKLNAKQVELEKAKILAALIEWKAAHDKDIKEIVEKLGLRNSTWLPDKASHLLYHWNNSVDDMIEFLNKDLTTYDDELVFFVLENDTANKQIVGIAISLGLVQYNHRAKTIIGINEGTYFIINDMIISEKHIFSRCFPTHYNEPQQSIGKALLQAIVRHVSMFEIPYPIAAQPHYTNEHAYNFFKKNNFTFDYGCIGHSCVLKTDEFEKILEPTPVEITAGNHYAFLQPPPLERGKTDSPLIEPDKTETPGVFEI